MKKPASLNDLKIMLVNNSFAIFGAGPIGSNIYGACKLINCIPVGFCDNYRKSAYGLPEVPVYLPINLIRNHPDIIFLISAQSQNIINQISTQLMELKFPESQIIWFDELLELLKEVELNWNNCRENEYNWQKNNKIIEYMAQWINEKDTSVADLGCGKEMHLRKQLHPKCKYIPVDYISRSNDTIVCDFNDDKLPELKFDVAFLCGVLMYLYDPAKFLNWLCIVTKKKIILRFAQLNELTQKEKFSGHVSCGTVEFVDNIIKTNGFKITKKEISFDKKREYILLCYERV